MAGVNPTILAWARETAGLSLAEAARKIGLNDARGVEGADRLAAYEAGEGLPSATVLRRMAQQYRRPMLTFYLAAPPESDDIGEDFRTLPERSDPQNVLLATLLRDVKARQSLVREVIEDHDDAAPVAFVGGRDQTEGAAAVAASIAADIGFERAVYRARRNQTEAFDYLRACAERAGVFVLLAGDLGS